MDKEVKTASEDRIAALENQVETLMALLRAQNIAQPINAKEDKITIVNLVERNFPCTTHIELTNLVISMSHMGEERTLTMQQFEELISKYRSWFNKGIIAVMSGYEEVAHKYGIETTKKYPVKSDFIQSLGSVSMTQLEEVFPKLPIAGQESIVTYWLRQARNGNAAFRDIRKLETLNRLSDGKLSQFIDELNAERRQNHK